jgi:hypothetical protein
MPTAVKLTERGHGTQSRGRERGYCSIVFQPRAHDRGRLRGHRGQYRFQYRVHGDQAGTRVEVNHGRPRPTPCCAGSCRRREDLPTVPGGSQRGEYRRAGQRETQYAYRPEHPGQMPKSSTVWSTSAKPASLATCSAHRSTARPSTSTLRPHTRQVRW